MGTTDRQGRVILKHLEFWKIGYWEQLSELRDDMAGRTVVGTTDRHRPFSEKLVSELCDVSAGRTVTGTMTRHRLRNPDWVGFLLNVLRGALDYSCF